MAENSGIEWTHHTFNPWWGCTKVSPACDNCYAEVLDKRFGGDHWGPKAERRRTGAKNWNEPRKWNAAAEKLGIRYRVFCASMADVFDNKVDPSWRVDLFKLIRETPHLDWLLLTKRPQLIAKMLPADWGTGYPNVWLMTTAENQPEYDRRVDHLLSVPAVVHGLSMEPLLGPVNMELTRAPRDQDYNGWDHCAPISTVITKRGQSLKWVIVGGESGPNFRPGNPDWFRSLRDQCVAANVPFLFKQWEGRTQSEIKKLGRELDGVVWDQYPTPDPRGTR